MTTLAPAGRYGISVVADVSDDMSSDPFDVTVLSVEFRIVVFEPVPIDSAVVHKDVDTVSVPAVVKLLVIVNVG